jgi:hypothetical protein
MCRGGVSVGAADQTVYESRRAMREPQVGEEVRQLIVGRLGESRSNSRGKYEPGMPPAELKKAQLQQTVGGITW